MDLIKNGGSLINRLIEQKISEGVMKLTRNNFQSFAEKGMKLFKIDTNKLSKK